MTHREAINCTVTKEEAKREIEKHDSEPFEMFLLDVGDKPEYRGYEVLNWLGY